jgi:ferrous iron transport protein B
LEVREEATGREIRLEQLDKIRHKAEYVFALAGNPNVGKSTIFNRITGMGVMTANYPGMTVELNLALTETEGRKVGIVDLPGTYALGAISEDQLVARRGILQGNPDLVIVILDANNLARNLYLLLQVMDLGYPAIAALNLVDQAEKSGTYTDPQLLSEILGIPVVTTVGVRGDGLDELMHQALEMALRREDYHVLPFSYAMDLESRIRRLAQYIKKESQQIPYGLSPRALAILLLEQDKEMVELVRGQPGGESILDMSSRVGAEIEREHGQTAAMIIARERHGIAGSIAASVQARRAYDKPRAGERLWELTTSFRTGIPILLIVLGTILTAIFWGGSSLATQLTHFWTSFVSEPAGHLLTSAFGTNIFSQSLLWAVDGLGAVLEIALPYLVVFYLILAVMEDTGYLNSVAFLSDRFMHKLGLHGRAIIPLVSAVGCNVPAIMGTRVLSTRRERIIASTLIVLIPCSARVAVIIGAVGLFAGWGPALLLFGLVFIIVAAAGLLMNKMLPGESTGLVMEMFPFRQPSMVTVLKKTWLRLKDFLYVAAPLIVMGSFILGFLYETGWIFKLTVPLKPIMGSLLGLPAVAGLALIFAFLRKELALALLVVLAAQIIPNVTTSSTLLDFMTRGQIFTFALVCTLYIPCIAAFGALKRELGWKAAFGIGALTTTIALVAGGLSHLIQVLAR